MSGGMVLGLAQPRHALVYGCFEPWIGKRQACPVPSNFLLCSRGQIEVLLDRTELLYYASKKSHGIRLIQGEVINRLAVRRERLPEPDYSPDPIQNGDRSKNPAGDGLPGSTHLGPDNREGPNIAQL